MRRVLVLSGPTEILRRLRDGKRDGGAVDRELQGEGGDRCGRAVLDGQRELFAVAT
jgi:hypothetical protein